MKVLIWGTGDRAKAYLSTREIKKGDIIGFVESNPKILEFWNEFYRGGGYTVYKPADIRGLEYDFILVCVWCKESIEEIIKTCIKLDILDCRVAFMRNICGLTLKGDNLIYYNKYQDNEKIHKIFPVFFNRFMEFVDINMGVFSARTNEDILHDSILQTPDFYEYRKDYFRYRTFEFVAEEIKINSIAGSVAEVGVAFGTFSKLINAAFPDRDLYMFDTFDSFDRKEFDNDISTASKNEDFYKSYKNINVEDVIKIMPHKERCIIKRGLFPYTTVDLEDNIYAFVSIDVDLENSIYNGLEYFYPRLSSGGYIFVHDYRCYDLQGVKKAVRRYEEEYGNIYKVPMADRGGTLIITK